MSFEIRPVSLRELLSAEREFVMARYQRHYEWSRREMEHLTGDIGEAFAELRAGRAADIRHFFNSVIFYRDGTARFQVVDGQQRLSSLALVLAIARSELPGTKSATDIDAMLRLPGGGRSGAGPRQRLVLHRGDNGAFGPIILSGEGLPEAGAKPRADRPGIERLYNNAIIARNWFLSVPPADREAMVQFIADRSVFVAIEVVDEVEAFRIFETVNSRGRAISSEDVLRFALIEYAVEDTAKRDELFARWDALESELGSEGLKRYVSNWRSRAAGAIRPRMPLHRVVLDSFDTPASALAFLEKELSADVAVFSEIDDADTDVQDLTAKARIDALLQSLHLVKFDDWVPLASEALRRWRATPGDLVTVLTALERICWFYYLNANAKGIVNERRDRLSGALKTLGANSTASDVAGVMALETRELERLRNALPDRIDPRWPPLRSLIVRLEMHVSKNQQRVVREELTLEHILPRNASSKAWLSEFDNDPALLDRYAEHPGNLCVLPASLNNELGSKTYANKQKIIRRHGAHKRYALAADFDAEPRWNAAVIERRGAWMRAKLREIFGV